MSLVDLMSGMCGVLMGNFSLFGIVLLRRTASGVRSRTTCWFPNLTLGRSDVPGWGALILKGAHLTGWSQGGVLPFTRF